MNLSPRAVSALSLASAAFLACGSIHAQGFETRLSINPTTSPLPVGQRVRLTPIGVETTRNSIVFPALDAFGRELWRSDGTPAGTFRLTNINILGDSVDSDGNSVLAFRDGVQDVILFRADDGINGPQIWQTDGTAGAEVMRTAFGGAGVTTGEMVRDAIGRIWFAANDGVSGDELWVLNGAAGAPVQVSTTALTLPPDNLVTVSAGGAPVVFFQGNGAGGTEPWVSDGVVTQRIVDLFPGPQGGGTLNASVFAGQFYFSGFDGVSRGLFRADVAGSTQVPPVPPVEILGPVGARLQDPSRLVECNGAAYLTARTASGRGVYRLSAGSLTATLVAPLNSGGGLACADGSLFLQESTPAGGSELFISSPAGSALTQVADINPGAGSSVPQEITPAGSGGVLFRATDTGTGQSLFFSDGTSTVKLVDASVANAPEGFVRSGRNLFWTATFQGRNDVFTGDVQAAGDFLAEDFAVGSPATNGPVSAQRIGLIPEAGGALLLQAFEASGAPFTGPMDFHFMAPTVGVDIAIPGTSAPCEFFASASAFSVPAAGGLLFVSIPPTSTLAGQRLYVQGIFLDPAGNCLVPGVSVTNPVDVVFR